MKCPHIPFRIWLAVVLTLTVALMPHHHHGEEVCTALKTCETDGRVNDRHTGHSTGRDCDESDCHIQAMRTYLSASVRHADTGSIWLLPAGLLPEAWSSVPLITVAAVKRVVLLAALPASNAHAATQRGPPTATWHHVF